MYESRASLPEAELDAPVGADSAHFIVAWIGHLGDTLWIRPRRRLIELRRHTLIQRLVRSLLVVLTAKGVKEPLLRREIGGWGAGRLSLQIPVHPLMTAILLRTPRLNPQRLDPQLDPPHRKPRQPGQAGRAEGDAIVTENGFGQPLLTEQPFEGRAHASMS